MLFLFRFRREQHDRYIYEHYSWPPIKYDYVPKGASSYMGSKRAIDLENTLAHMADRKTVHTRRMRRSQDTLDDYGYAMGKLRMVGTFTIVAC